VGKRVAREDQSISPEDQRKLDRWLTANAILSSIFAVGLIAFRRRHVTQRWLKPPRRQMLLLPNKAICGQECGTFTIGTNSWPLSPRELHHGAGSHQILPRRL
jgi:hypothetical protein